MKQDKLAHYIIMMVAKLKQLDSTFFISLVQIDCR
jgi:hypothetical protein